jgi:hypothetical protein
MNINTFRSQVFNTDLARDNLFKFTLNRVPSYIQNFSTFADSIKSVPLYAKGVTFSPNSVTNNPRQGDGYKRIKTIQDVEHQSDLEVTLLVEPEHIHYAMFDYWITNMMAAGDTVRFFEDCVGNCTVEQLNRQSETTSEFLFTDIYPISIGPKVYVSGTAGAPSEFTVNFSYRDMSII